MAEQWTPWAVHPPIGTYIEVEDDNGKMFYGYWHPDMELAWVGKSENDTRGPGEIVRWRPNKEEG
jgi:hypothetical protein